MFLMRKSCPKAAVGVQWLPSGALPAWFPQKAARRQPPLSGAQPPGRSQFCLQNCVSFLTEKHKPDRSWCVQHSWGRTGFISPSSMGLGSRQQASWGRCCPRAVRRGLASFLVLPGDTDTQAECAFLLWKLIWVTDRPNFISWVYY